MVLDPRKSQTVTAPWQGAALSCAVCKLALRPSSQASRMKDAPRDLTLGPASGNEIKLRTRLTAFRLILLSITPGKIQLDYSRAKTTSGIQMHSSLQKQNFFCNIYLGHF